MRRRPRPVVSSLSGRVIVVAFFFFFLPRCEVVGPGGKGHDPHARDRRRLLDPPFSRRGPP